MLTGWMPPLVGHPLAFFCKTRPGFSPGRVLAEI
jgi:hypothetical protein